MSIILIKELFRDGASGMEDHEGKREAIRVFMVQTSDAGDGQAQILDPGMVVAQPPPGTLATLPKLFDVYQDPNGLFLDAGCLLAVRECRRDKDDPWYWTVACHYTTDILNKLLGARNPLLRRAVPDWQTEIYQKPYSEDVTGTACNNAAGEPMDPAPERDESRTIFTLTKNIALAVWDPSLQQRYQNKVNSDFFYGYRDGVVKCNTITASQDTETGFTFYRVTARFTILEPDPAAPTDSPWLARELNCGYRQVDANMNLVAIRDPVTNQPYSTPTLLDLQGHAQTTFPGSPTYIDLQPYQQVPFIPLANLFGAYEP